MSNRHCPTCGEEYSDTYRTCPFCEEEAAIRRGKPLRRRGGKRVEKRQNDRRSAVHGGDARVGAGPAHRAAAAGGGEPGGLPGADGEGVVTIDANGVVKWVGKGNTTITATVDGVTLECIVRAK